jgi:hypothetical protein
VAWLALPGLLRNRYERCQLALDVNGLKDPGVAYLLNFLKGSGQLRETDVNVNGAYRASALNVLVPNADASWPAQCGLEEEPAQCRTSARDGYIVCNPAIGRELRSPLLRSSIASAETWFASHFVLLSILGHELSHVRAAEHDEAEHAYRPDRSAGMSCRAGPADEKTAEILADEQGMAMACAALRATPNMANLPENMGGALDVVSMLERQIDEKYFNTDDVCVGDASYPSMSRRKHGFSRGFLSCLYPTQGNPLAALAEDTLETFKRLEKWLNERQLRGQIASGSFGKGGLYSHRVVDTVDSKRFVTFDSLGTEAALWSVVDDGKRILPERLAHWDTTGRVIDARRIGEADTLLLLLNNGRDDGGRRIGLVRVSCGGAEGRCQIASQTRGVEESASVQAAPDGSVLVADGNGLQVFPTAEALFSGQPIQQAGWQPESDIEANYALAPGRSLSVVARRGGEVRDGGFHLLRMLTPAGAYGRALLPDAPGAIESLAIIGTRLWIAFAHNPLVGSEGFRLYDCPLELIANVESATSAQCVVYTPPEDINNSAALAAGNLAAQFEYQIAVACDGNAVTVTRRGWVWVLEPARNRQDVLVADGLVRCGEDEYVTYRARRVDYLRRVAMPVDSSSGKIASVTARPD